MKKILAIVGILMFSLTLHGGSVVVGALVVGETFVAVVFLPIEVHRQQRDPDAERLADH